MSMDLIAGTVILTAVFLVVAGAYGVLYSRSTVGQRSGAEEPQRGKILLAVLLIVYAVGITNVFVITQQYNLAFTNLTVGIVLAAIQYFSGASRAKGNATNQAAPRVDTADAVRPDQ